MASTDINKASANLLALLVHAKETVAAPPLKTAPVEAPLYPLVASIAALTKAQTTKLALVIKLPLEDPKAAARVINDITKDIVPALLTVFQIAVASDFGLAVHDGIKQSISSIFAGFEELVSGIEHEEGSGSSKSRAKGKNEEKKAPPDRLAATGKIWEASDRLTHIAQSRLVGLIAEKVKAHNDLLKDAVDEFKEWLESARDDADSGFDELTSSQELAHERDVDADDQDFWDADKLPPSGATRDLAAPVLKKMRQVAILLRAVLKHRLHPSPTRLGCSNAAKSSEAELDVDVERLDGIGRIAKDITSAADDTAAAFYEGDTDEAATAKETMISKAKELANACKMVRGGEGTDEFSKWIDEKFLGNIDKNGAE